jgi:DNA-binding Lrp family transcriptional regulator
MVFVFLVEKAPVTTGFLENSSTKYRRYKSPISLGISLHTKAVDCASYCQSESVEVFCRDREHLTKFIINQIQAIQGVRATETLVIGKIFKLSFFWRPEIISQDNES